MIEQLLMKLRRRAKYERLNEQLVSLFDLISRDTVATKIIRQASINVFSQSISQT